MSTSKSRSRSPAVKSRSSSRSSSGSKSRSRSRSRSRSGGRSRSRTPLDGSRLHVADLGLGVSKRELERVFDRFGPLREIFLARSPPCFAFVVYRHKTDAVDALKTMDGNIIGGHRVRVTFALPRTRGRGRKFDPSMRCFQCGERGHFSRDCIDTKYGFKRPPMGKNQRATNGTRHAGNYVRSSPMEKRRVTRSKRSVSRSHSRSRSNSRDRSHRRKGMA